MSGIWRIIDSFGLKPLDRHKMKKEVREDACNIKVFRDNNYDLL